MRMKEVEGILDGLLGFRGWKSPVGRVRVVRELRYDLLRGESNYSERDSLLRLWEEKRRWFFWIVGKLNGHIEDFQKVFVQINNEFRRVEIVYKGKDFSKKVRVSSLVDDLNHIRRRIENLEPVKLRK